MGAAGLASTAGCLGGGGDGNSGDGGDGSGDGGGGNSAPFPEATDVTDIFLDDDGRLEIPPGEFEDYELEFPEGGALSYEFENTAGFAIDVLLIRDGEFRYYEQGNRVNYNPANSTQGQTSGSSSARISSGNYHLVFDNTELANAQPPTPSGGMQEETETDASGTDAGTDTGTDAGTEAAGTAASTETASGGGDDSRTAVVEFSLQAGR